MANIEKIVTRELVFEVADRLKVAGIEPSNRKLLHEIGGGSMTTIAGHLRDWKAQQDITVPAQVDAIQVPLIVVDAGNLAIAAIWQACNVEARREIEAVTEQANQRIKAAEDERDGALTELSEAETELSTSRQNNSAIAAELEFEREESSAIKNENSQLKAEVDKIRAVNEEIERRANDLNNTLYLERERASLLQKKVYEQDEEIHQKDREIYDRDRELVPLRIDILRTRDDLNAEEKRVAELLKKIDVANERVLKAEARADNAVALAEKKVAEAIGAAAELRGRLATLQEQLSKDAAKTKPNNDKNA